MPHVMVVDDSVTQRTILTEFLESMATDLTSFEITCCVSGDEALMEVSERVPDLIILDVEMPGLSGFDTCKAIRGFLQDTWVPIIYLTGRTDPEDIVEGLSAGGDTYITKPVHQEVFKAIAKAMLRVSDIQAQLLEANKALDEIAHFDALTQIMNRRGYEDMLARLWKDHERRNSPLSILLLDIDSFKKYNDGYGHIKGDECLRDVAQTLKQALKRPIDIIARYGGEEFVVLLPGTDKAGAVLVGERFVEAMKQANIPHEYSEAAKHVTVSIGAAQAESEDTIEKILKRADEALYQAKEAGRNQVC